MSEQANGFSQMNERAQAAQQLAAAHSEALLMDAQNDIVNPSLEAIVMNAQVDAIAVDEKANKPEIDRVSKLNDEAQIRIFGTGNKRDAEGFIVGAYGLDGAPLEAPIKGKLDKIENDRSKGDNAAERKENAKDYINDITELTDEGFELTQAELIVDLRKERQAKEQKLYEKLVNNNTANSEVDGQPMTVAQAKEAAKKRVLDKRLKTGDDEAVIRDFVKGEKIYTIEDYEETRFGAEHRGNSKFEEYRLKHTNEVANAQKAASDAEIKDTIADKKAIKQNRRDFVENNLPTPEANTPRERGIRYEPREDGRIQMAFDIVKEGETIDFSKYARTNSAANRKVIVSDTDGNEYYIRGDHMYYIPKTSGDTKITHRELIGDKIPDLTIGSTWKLNEGTESMKPIQSVEIALDIEDPRDELNNVPNEGFDPFEFADNLIDQDNARNLPAPLPGRPRTGAAAPVPAKAGRFERLRNNRAVLVAALAATAVAGAMLGVFAGKTGDTQPDKPTTPAAKTTPKSTAKATPSKPTAARTVTLKQGEDPWVVSAQQLGVSNTAANVAQIRAYDQRMAELNGNYSLDQDDERDNNMPVGTTLKLPK